jgi:hypothetical protein
MAVWVCKGCTAAYSVGAPRCPQCGSTEYADEEEQNMPKITVQGGPSIAGVSGGWSDTDSADPWPAPGADEVEGGEESSPGTSSSPSETKQSSEPETTSSGGSKRARTTGSRGGQARTGSSTARSTDTGQTARTSETDSDED